MSSDETTVEYTHDTAITAFSLGSLDRYTKTKAGKDTLLKANVTGSDYKFYIDQAQRLIYNVDSLPCGVRDTAILATISSKNSSPILLMDINKTDSVAAYYSSSDSINFSKPRFIRVYSSDYSAYAQYKVTVNVHKELPYEFKWHELAQNNSQLAAFSDLKAVACGDYIYVFGKTTDGTEVLKSAINNGSAWSSITMNVSLSSDAYQSAVALDGELYISDGGKVYASADAKHGHWFLKMQMSSSSLVQAARISMLIILLQVSLFQKTRVSAGRQRNLIKMQTICQHRISQ